MRDSHCIACPIYSVFLACCTASCIGLASSRGCLWERTRVEMADGTQKELGQIELGDEVSSWDDEAHRIVGATVIGVETVTARWLVELAFKTDDVAGAGGSGVNVSRGSPLSLAENISHSIDQRQHASPASGSLVMTPDHPIFSMRCEGLVSMDPKLTRTNYGLDVEQMGHRELLHHYQNHVVGAYVRHILGSGFVLMTLQLARYHWFYANGVRVHNKGRATGGSFHTSKAKGSSDSDDASSTSWVEYTNSSFDTSTEFAEFILTHAGNRRRHGNYMNDSASSCTMHPEQEVEAACESTIFADDSNIQPCCSICHDCLNCTQEICMRSIPSCDNFLAQAFASCTISERRDSKHVDEQFMIFVWIASGVLVGCPCFFCACRYGRKWNRRRLMADEITSMSQYRNELSACNEHGLSHFEAYAEQVSERGISRICLYSWTFESTGDFVGRGKHEEGIPKVEGKLHWASAEEVGEIVWVEHWINYDVEVRGAISLSDQRITIDAEYLYPYERGTLVLQESIEADSGVQQLEKDVARLSSEGYRQSIESVAIVQCGSALSESFAKEQVAHVSLHELHRPVCPQLHECRPFATESDGWNCDVCGATFGVQKILFGCQECEWVCCEGCTAKQQATGSSNHKAAASQSDDFMIPEEEGVIREIPSTPEVGGTLLCAE